MIAKALVLISVMAGFGSAAGADTPPLAWRRARADVTRGFATAFGQVVAGDASAVDWRPAYNALARARARARGGRADEFLSYVVAGGIAEAGRRVPTGLTNGDLVESFQKQVLAHPDAFQARAMLPLAFSSLGAHLTNAVVGMSGVIYAAVHLLSDVGLDSGRPSQFLVCAAGFTGIGCATLVAQAVITADFDRATRRVQALGSACEALLAELVADPPVVRARGEMI
jgi:hypothetical protein